MPGLVTAPEASPELAMKGDDMGDEQGRGSEASSASPTPTPSERPLVPKRGQEDADALIIYPRDRYLAARRGEISRADFANDLVRHVQAQISPLPVATASSAIHARS